MISTLIMKKEEKLSFFTRSNISYLGAFLTEKSFLSEITQREIYAISDKIYCSDIIVNIEISNNVIHL